MAKPFNKLREKMSPERQARARAKTEAMLSDMALGELRQAFDLSQEQIGIMMKINQPAVSKIEKNTDMFINTLRRYIEAVGGELEITARFADKRIRINQFEEIRTNQFEEIGEK